MKNNLIFKNIKLKSFFISLFIFLFLINFFLNLNFSNKAFAQENKSNSELQQAQDDLLKNAEKDLIKLNNNGKGLINCSTSNSDRECAPVDIFKTAKNLIFTFIYLVIIILLLLSTYYAVLYVKKGDNPQFLEEIKKRLKQTLAGLFIAVGGFALIVGVLKYTGFDENILDYVQKLLSFNNQSSHFIFIESSYAQNADLPTIDEVVDKAGDSYFGFLPTDSLPRIFINTFKFLRNYIATPILIGYIFYTGVLFVKARGNKEELLKARKFALRVVIAIGVVALAPYILNLLLSAVLSILTS